MTGVILLEASEGLQVHVIGVLQARVIEVTDQSRW